jgi:putative component of toxin-antitoxin plasmid stabilization module
MAENHENVIPPDSDPWTFMSFVTESGRDVALDWDTHNTFAVKNHRDWTAWRHPMEGKAGEAGVVELGFKAGKPYRVLCMFNGRLCIVVLCVTYHKGPVWNPKEAVKIATERAKLVTAGKAKLNVVQSEDDI